MEFVEDVITFDTGGKIVPDGENKPVSAELFVPTSIYDQHQDALFWHQLTEIEKRLELAKADSDSSRIEQNETKRSLLFRAKAEFEMKRDNDGDAAWYAAQINSYTDKVMMLESALDIGSVEVILALGDLRKEAEASNNPMDLVEYLIFEVKLGFNTLANLDALDTLMKDRSVMDSPTELLVKNRMMQIYYDRAVETLQSGDMEQFEFFYRKLDINRRSICEQLKTIQDPVEPFIPENASRGQIREANKKAELTLRFYSANCTSNFLRRSGDVLFYDERREKPQIIIEVLQLVRQGYEPARRVIVENFVSNAGYMLEKHSGFARALYDLFPTEFQQNFPGKEATFRHEGSWVAKKSADSFVLANLSAGNLAEAEAKYAVTANQQSGLDPYRVMVTAMELALYKKDLDRIDDEQITDISSRLELLKEEYAKRLREIQLADPVDRSRWRTEFNRRLDELIAAAQDLPYLAERFTMLVDIALFQKEHDTSEDSAWEDLQETIVETAAITLDNHLALLTLSPKEVHEKCNILGIDLQAELSKF